MPQTHSSYDDRIQSTLTRLNPIPQRLIPDSFYSLSESVVTQLIYLSKRFVSLVSQISHYYE